MGSGVYGCNISEKYKFVWVAPERTGSRKVAEILTYYGFTNNGKKVFDTEKYGFSHYCNPNENHNDYKIICNLRNPYSRVYSLFKNFYGLSSNKDKDSFKRYLVNDLPVGQMAKMVVNPILNRNPDYIIRLENMYEDLLKLPFILDVLNENQLKMLSTHGKPIDEWEEFYDSESKSIVYDFCKDHFIFGGYEK